jgi:hypothetical protein
VSGSSSAFEAWALGNIGRGSFGRPNPSLAHRRFSGGSPRGRTRCGSIVERGPNQTQRVGEWLLVTTAKSEKARLAAPR